MFVNGTKSMLIKYRSNKHDLLDTFIV